jgi:UDP-N-acetyl-2-amino-2-deoxyglucuronate dehydrogenase
VRLALRVHATAICEKPLVVSPWNLDQLAELEREYQCRIYSILQLRLHPDLVALRERLLREPRNERAEVTLTYITRRGRWYDVSWKGQEQKSGGVAMNIGVHFFDLLMWLFGSPTDTPVHLHEDRRLSGVLELERARVRWFLSVEGEDLPEGYLESGRHAYRSLLMDGHEIEFSDGFQDLHTRAYAGILAGDGFGIEDARPAIEIVHRIRQTAVTPHRGEGHPLLTSRG